MMGCLSVNRVHQISFLENGTASAKNITWPGFFSTGRDEHCMVDSSKNRFYSSGALAASSLAVRLAALRSTLGDSKIICMKLSRKR